MSMSWRGLFYGLCILGVTVPVTAPATDVGSVGAASSAGAASRVDGTVWMWGAQIDGQLGDGVSRGTFGLEPVTEPQPVSGLTGVKEVTSGGLESYAILEDGSLWGWGGNSNGELGDGTQEEKTRPIRLPIPGDVAITQVSASSSHALAVDAEGQARSAGSNDDQQLGEGGGAWNRVDGPWEEDVVEVSAGDSHSLALTADGQVWSWGDSSWDMLGRETDSLDERRMPGPVENLEDIEVAAIAAGQEISAAVAEDGTLYTWGRVLDSARGRGGDGPPEAVSMRDELDAEKPVAMGFRYGFVGDEQEGLQAWGRNNDGQLGIGSTDNASSPVRVQAFDGVERRVEALTVGASRTFVIDDRYRLYAWGSNHRQALGIGTTDDERTTPQPVKPAEADEGSFSTAFVGEGVLPFYLQRDTEVGERGWRVSEDASLSGDYSIEPESDTAGERAAIAVRGDFREGATLSFQYKLSDALGELRVKADGETLWSRVERTDGWTGQTIQVPSGEEQQTLTLVWVQTSDAPEGNGVWVDNLRLPAGQLGSEAILGPPAATQEWADALEVETSVTPLVDELDLFMEYRPKGEQDWRVHQASATIDESENRDLVLGGLRCGQRYEVRARAETEDDGVETGPVAELGTLDCADALGEVRLESRSPVRLSYSAESPALYHGYEGFEESRNQSQKYELIVADRDASALDSEFDIDDERLEVDVLQLDCERQYELALAAEWETDSGDYELGLLEPMPQAETQACTGGSAVRERTGGSGDDECFVATAAHGSSMAPDVQLLRLFRDRVLARFEAGRTLTALYYEHGQKPAEAIASRPDYKALVRGMLAPMVALAWLMLNPGVLVAGVMALALSNRLVREVLS